MYITIKSKQMEVSTRTRAHVERKLQRLSRMLGEEARVEVTVAEEKTRSTRDRYSVRMEFFNTPYSIRGTASDVNVNTALDEVLDKVEIQLSRQKSRHTTAHRLPDSPVKVLSLSRAGEVAEMAENGEHEAALDHVENEEIWTQVKEIRRVQTRPMDQQEVITRMDAEGLSFYPFFNEATASVNVMYRLAGDTGYGLLVPALE